VTGVLRHGGKYGQAVAQFERRGHRYAPVNEKAQAICQLAGMSSLPEYKLADIEAVGLMVEIKQTKGGRNAGGL
jgi:hypothetical protein